MRRFCQVVLTFHRSSAIVIIVLSAGSNAMSLWIYGTYLSFYEASMFSSDYTSYSSLDAVLNLVLGVPGNIAVGMVGTALDRHFSNPLHGSPPGTGKVVLLVVRYVICFLALMGIILSRRFLGSMISLGVFIAFKDGALPLCEYRVWLAVPAISEQIFLLFFGRLATLPPYRPSQSVKSLSLSLDLYFSLFCPQMSTSCCNFFQRSSTVRPSETTAQ